MQTPDSESAPKKSTYVLNAESAEEMSRLLRQDAFLTKEAGGLFPERSDLSSIHDVLDIACGPAVWALDLAYAHRHMHVTGVDTSQRMIDYNNTRKLPNTTFQVMNVLHGLDFPDASFDLVNARFIFSFMPPTAWPTLIQECWRVTRPGGLIRLTEWEYPITNAPACEKMNGLFTQALHLAGQSFSPDGRHLAITPMLESFLQEANYTNIQRRVFTSNFSWNADAYKAVYEINEIGYLLIQPFLLKMGVATEEELSALYKQGLQEMQSSTFRGMAFYLSVLGEKT
jgi:ubiquinone/menaquinone biosynthesis C-methylase UbiE